MASKVLSRLRRTPDELVIPNGSGGRAKLLKDGVLEVVCKDCHYVFWVRSNMVNCCPSCRSSNIEKTWTRPQIAFIPQYE